MVLTKVFKITYRFKGQLSNRREFTRTVNAFTSDEAERNLRRNSSESISIIKTVRV